MKPATSKYGAMIFANAMRAVLPSL